MARSCLVSCCSDWNVAWGSAGCAADEEPAAAEGAFDNDLDFTKTGNPWMLDICNIDVFDIKGWPGIWVVFYAIS